jgi:hypothetical protein
MNLPHFRFLALGLALTLAGGSAWVVATSAAQPSPASSPTAVPAQTTAVPESPKPNPHRDEPWVLPVGEPTPPKDEAAAPVLRHCALCHSFDYISTQPRLSKTAWTASVEKMRAKYGAPIPTNEVPALVAYLVKHHGKE